MSCSFFFSVAFSAIDVDQFKELGMNDILLTGQDVLQRIKKALVCMCVCVHSMVTSKWLEECEMHVHTFLWTERFDEDTKEVAITQVNTGDRPADCVAQLAICEMVMLPTSIHLVEKTEIILTEGLGRCVLLHGFTGCSNQNCESPVIRRVSGLLDSHPKKLWSNSWTQYCTKRDSNFL